MQTTERRYGLTRHIYAQQNPTSAPRPHLGRMGEDFRLRMAAFLKRMQSNPGPVHQSIRDGSPRGSGERITESLLKIGKGRRGVESRCEFTEHRMIGSSHLGGNRDIRPESVCEPTIRGSAQTRVGLTSIPSGSLFGCLPSADLVQTVKLLSV
jgi:hypothetical protein